MENEIWKDIKGFEGLYQISNFGRVKSLKRKRFNYRLQKTIEIHKEIILKPFEDKKGYLCVKLQNNKNKTMFKVHRLVAKTFIPNPDDLPQINHINGIKNNNNMHNLEWCNCSYNVKEAFRLGLSKKGKHHYNRKRVIQYDLNGNFIKLWDCMIDAINELNLRKSSWSSISQCCKGKRKSAYGYIWKYAD